MRCFLSRMVLGMVAAGCLMGVVGCQTTGSETEKRASTSRPARKEPGESKGVQDGKAAYNEGNYARAAQLLTAQLTEAWALDDADAIADSALWLGKCSLVTGNPDKAAELLREARAEYSRLSDERGEAACWVLEAEAALAQGKPEKVEDLTERALDLLAGTSKGETLARTHAIRAAVACDSRDSIGARLELSQAIAAAGSDLENAFLAELSMTGGRIHMLERSYDKAAEEFGRSAAWSRESKLQKPMADALSYAGRAYARAGVREEAASAYFRAGRSYFVQGVLKEAQRNLEAALALAGKLRDAELSSRCMSVLNVVKDRLSAQEDAQ